MPVGRHLVAVGYAQADGESLGLARIAFEHGQLGPRREGGRAVPPLHVGGGDRSVVGRLGRRGLAAGAFLCRGGGLRVLERQRGRHREQHHCQETCNEPLQLDFHGLPPLESVARLYPTRRPSVAGEQGSAAAAVELDEMSIGSKLLWRLLAAGLAAGPALCLALGAVFWKIAASAHPRRPSAVEALREPPRIDFWERVDLVLFRGRAAFAGAAAPSAPARGTPGGTAVRGEPSRPVAAAVPDPYRQTAAADESDLAAALSARGVPGARRRSLLDQVRRLREALLREDE